MILILITALTAVIPGPGWSDPVISIETPDWDYHRKDLVVTDGNHVHQIWNNYEGEARIGYNVVLSDGTVLVPDTLISRDSFSGHPSASYAPDSGFIGFWREGAAKWYSVKDHEGNTVVPATFYSSEGYSSWFRIDSSLDSLGRVHMVWDSGPEVCYSILEPGMGELWRDTIPDSQQQALVLVDGNRVHIKFNGPDQWADYIQYDLNGNVTVPTVSLSEDLADATNRCSMEVDGFHNVYIIVSEGPEGGPLELRLYKIDGYTGDVLIDGLLLYTPPGIHLHSPHIIASPSGDSLYLVWIEDEVSSGFMKLIKFAIIDTNGDFIEEPYIAYDYTDEDPEDLRELAVHTNHKGDIFAIWSEYFPSIEKAYIVLGWFDHNWLSIEEESESTDPEYGIDIQASANPFCENVEMTVTGDCIPGQLSIYDLSGRIVRTLNITGNGIFFWDGCDPYGNEVPAGNYIVRANSEHHSASIQIIKI